MRWPAQSTLRNLNVEYRDAWYRDPTSGAGNEFCERLAFYGLATNLVIYLQTVMGADPASAATNLMVFEGTCYLTPLLGAWLADSLWGRYKTILVFSVIYMIVSPSALVFVSA